MVIVLTLKGGSLQDVFVEGSGEVTKAVLVDFDWEGVFHGNLITTNGKSYAVVDLFTVEKLPEKGPVRSLVEKAAKKFKSWGLLPELGKA